MTYVTGRQSWLIDDLQIEGVGDRKRNRVVGLVAPRDAHVTARIRAEPWPLLVQSPRHIAGRRQRPAFRVVRAARRVVRTFGMPERELSCNCKNHLLQHVFDVRSVLPVELPARRSRRIYATHRLRDLAIARPAEPIQPAADLGMA